MPIPEYIRKLRQKVGHELLLVVGVAAVILNHDDEILMQLRSDFGLWGIPGGLLEPGEDPAEAVMREILEETGLHVTPQRIVGVYGGKDHLITYPNGDQVAVTSITFLCHVTGGEVCMDQDETIGLHWYAFDALPENMLPHHRERIVHAMTRETPFFRLPDGSA
jgi:8-oxo-dGTP pyrophosphatase MutT (NUDIX family)